MVEFWFVFGFSNRMGEKSNQPDVLLSVVFGIWRFAVDLSPFEQTIPSKYIIKISGFAMSFVVIVDIPRSPDAVRRHEQENAELLADFQKIAEKYQTSHRRFSGPNGVVDIDEFASEADYRTFLDEAGPHLEAYATRLGVKLHDTPLFEISG